MWQSIITIVGTLAGAVTAGLIQQRATRSERADARSETRRAERVQAVTALLVTLADHRRTMVLREEIRLTRGADADAYAAARTASHETRAAITAPHVTLSILVPELAAAAQAAVSAAYAIRGAEHAGHLEMTRANAVGAADKLVAAAARTAA
ncbi:protein kilB [Kitasatospora sp. NBC_01287]|uniref:protein kilB n=1 Tax=Kitasatospora sp. NBC_01287 TaxID=2903573 RepID=UPI0022587222|nr:protein kilB [Kitasatospora sp. NBC_01287]MCX4752010.1 protein kilB [Kitasatospora sp. NBC_01287]